MLLLYLCDQPSTRNCGMKLMAENSHEISLAARDASSEIYSRTEPSAEHWTRSQCPFLGHSECTKPWQIQRNHCRAYSHIICKFYSKRVISFLSASYSALQLSYSSLLLISIISTWFWQDLQVQQTNKVLCYSQLLFNPLKGRSFNWLQFAIQV